jgi:lambda family phage portal protein
MAMAAAKKAHARKPVKAAPVQKRGRVAARRLTPVTALNDWQWNVGTHDGGKFPGGFGPTQFLIADYWTLRARSSELFETNLYARGLIRRLVSNEINTGLHLEATPEEKILGREEDSLADWSEDVENRFKLWEKDPWLCDHTEQRSFGSLQSITRAEALITGDVLVTLRQYQPTGLPRVQLISGSAVQTPVGGNLSLRAGSRILHGVELDSQDRQVAYWVRQRDGTSKRLPAYGEKSGRKLAWLVYGTDKRLDQVRGKPILSLVLQSLKEIDRYRDSAQRKAVINSMLAMFIKRTENKPGSRPLSGGAQRRGTETVVGNDGRDRSFRVAEFIPGLVLDRLEQGEEPHGFQPHGTDEKFGDFERAIVQAIAWANEVPPEILMLSFGSNYSASQAAINEFKMYLNKVRTDFGENFCQPIYVEWLLAATLAGKVQAPGLLESWRDSAQYDVFGSWTSCDWSASIKPAVDLSKLVRGYSEMVAEGFITRDRATRELTGTKFSKNIKKLARENVQVAEANAPIQALENPAPTVVDQPDGGDDEDDDAPARPAAVLALPTLRW